MVSEAGASSAYAFSFGPAVRREEGKRERPAGSGAARRFDGLASRWREGPVPPVPNLGMDGVERRMNLCHVLVSHR